MRRALLSLALTSVVWVAACPTQSAHAAHTSRYVPSTLGVDTMPGMSSAVRLQGEPEEGVFFQPSDLSALDSYRIHYTLRWTSSTDGEGDAGYWDIWGEFVRRPPARRLVWTFAGGGGVKRELIQLGMAIYMNGGLNWVSLASTELDIFEDNPLLNSPTELISAYRGQLVQKGQWVNGLYTSRYALDGSSTGPAPGLGFGVQVRGDVWVSLEQELVVKYVLTYRGRNLADGRDDEALVRLTYDLVNINQPITILAPRGVKPAVPKDVAILADAVELSAVSGIIAYSSAQSAEEIRAFYRAQMPIRGWTETESRIAGGLAYAKAGRAAQIMLSSNGGLTRIVITCDM